MRLILFDTEIQIIYAQHLFLQRKTYEKYITPEFNHLKNTFVNRSREKMLLRRGQFFSPKSWPF